MYLKYILYNFSFFLLSISLYGQNRVISLVPSVTQQIYSLGAQDKLIGCTSFCNVEEKDNIDIVASAIDVNVEKVVALKPDLIFVSSLVKPQTIETFKKLDLKIKNIPSSKNFIEICQQFIVIGESLGKEQHARKIVEDIGKQYLELKNQIPKNQSPKIFIEIGTKPLFTVTPNTFMDDYIQFVGGVNIAHDMDHGTITRETVLVRNPDVIFIVSMGVMGEEETKIWSEYKNINAVKNNKIFVLDSNVASLPTPENFIKTVEEMVRLMYE